MNEHNSSSTSVNRVRMKLIFLAVAILVNTSFLAFGQASPKNISRPSKRDELRRQVLATDDRRIEALRRGDVAPLRQIYADDYSLVTPGGVIRSKADQINDLASGRNRYVTVEVVERTVRIYGDVAIVLSREKYNVLQAGQQVGGDMYITRTYKKFGRRWRLLATHDTFLKQ